MGVHDRSATSRWLHWTQASRKEADGEPPKDLPEQFNLEGPFLYSWGSNEVKSSFIGTGGCFLLMGGKWNVVEDILDLTHYTISVMGCMVSLSAGQDTVFRMFLRNTEDVEKWSKLMETASFLRVSDEYVAKLKSECQKQCKAQKRRSIAACFGAFTESLCAPRHSPTEIQAKLRRLSSMRNAMEGACVTYMGRFYLKSHWTEGKGRIYIHGDALILEDLQKGEVQLIAIPLTGVHCTTASFMISVRGANGLALLRLWLDNAEEAEDLAQRIMAAGKASTELVQRKIIKSTSTLRRQLGRAAESLCNGAMQAPQKFRNNLVPKNLSCWQRPQKKRSETTQDAPYLLDGRCAILRAKSTDVQASYCTLRGDALWFGVKAGACDQVMSVVGATATASEDMVMIKTRTGETHRLWPEAGSGSAQQWCRAIKEAGQLSKDLGKWDAMKRSLFFQETAQEKGRKVARERRFRIATQCITSTFGALSGYVCPEKYSATQAVLEWEAKSLVPREIKTDEAYPSCKANFFRRIDGNKAQPRTLDIRGDVMFVFNQKGQMEKPVVLAGTNIFVNLDRHPVVSIWSDGVMQARMFIETVQDAERWGELLEKAAHLEVTDTPIEKNEEAAGPVGPAMVREMSRTLKDVKAPAKMTDEEHSASQRLSKMRSRRFSEESSPFEPPARAVGA